MLLILGPFCLHFVLKNVYGSGITSYEGTKLLVAYGLDFYHYAFSEYMTFNSIILHTVEQSAIQW
jgi:hypothetical protein